MCDFLTGRQTERAPALQVKPRKCSTIAFRGVPGMRQFEGRQLEESGRNCRIDSHRLLWPERVVIVDPGKEAVPLDDEVTGQGSKSGKVVRLPDSREDRDRAPDDAINPIVFANHAVGESVRSARELDGYTWLMDPPIVRALIHHDRMGLIL
jgi:hypothetical protein